MGPVATTRQAVEQAFHELAHELDNVSNKLQTFRAEFPGHRVVDPLTLAVGYETRNVGAIKEYWERGPINLNSVHQHYLDALARLGQQVMSRRAARETGHIRPSQSRSGSRFVPPGSSNLARYEWHPSPSPPPSPQRRSEHTSPRGSESDSRPPSPDSSINSRRGPGRAR